MGRRALRFAEIREKRGRGRPIQTAAGSDSACAASIRRTVRAMKNTTAPPSVRTDAIMKRIDQKNPLAGSAPPGSLDAATATEQLGQANACTGSSQSRAKAVGRSVRIFI